MKIYRHIAKGYLSIYNIWMNNMCEEIEVSDANQLYNTVKGFINKKIYRCYIYKRKESTNLYTLRKAKNDFLKKEATEAKLKKMKENFNKKNS